MYPDDYDTVTVYTSATIKNMLSATISEKESEIIVLKQEINDLNDKLNKLISILPPELKLAFELTDDVPEKTED